MYFDTVLFVSPVALAMLSTLVVFPVLSMRNLAIRSRPDRSLIPIRVAASFTRTVLYIPSRIMRLYLSPRSGSVSGIPPVRRNCWNLAFLSASGPTGCPSRNSLNENGNTFISTYLPERYVESSDERR